MTKDFRGKKWFKPRELAQLGIIQSGSGSNNIHGNYAFILRMIKSGKLEAKNYSSSKTAYYLVSEDAIKKYHDSFDKVTP